MSLRKKGVITKLSAISLFIFLMLFNVKVAFSDKSTGDIDILGMKLSVFVPSAYASGYSCTVTTNCYQGSISCTGKESCSRTSSSVTCDGKTTNCF